MRLAGLTGPILTITVAVIVLVMIFTTITSVMAPVLDGFGRLVP